MIRVFVCADSRLELAGLEAFVRARRGFSLVGSGLGRAALNARLAAAEADVIVERMPAVGEDEPDALDLQFELPSIPTVILAEELEFGRAIAQLQAKGSAVRAVLPEWASENEIHRAIEGAAAGLTVLHPELMNLLLGETYRRDDAVVELAGETITSRETEVLNLLAAGLANKEIAWRLKISEHTVKFHVTSIFTKLDVASRAEAVAIGIRRGLIAV
jgi:DNA-binding NarL/FixJ family response regulator